MREIVLDTETTGLDPGNGDRVVEIGCVELLNHVATGKIYHQYINPDRPMPEEAFRIHGLSDEFLSGHPCMSEVMDEFLAFISDAPLVIHNAEFDMRFLNAELIILGKPALNINRALDTVRLAREKYPGAPASLDALCKRFNIDSTSRVFHGALLDAQLLAEVYLGLVGGTQPALELLSKGKVNEGKPREGVYHEPRSFPVTEEELISHKRFLEKIKEPIWRR